MPDPIYHLHHIVPRHAGGTDDPSNLVRLTIEEHAEAHRILWETHGRLGDKVAWLMLSGRTEEGEQARAELIKEALARPDVKAKMLAKARNRTPEHLARLSASLTGKPKSAEHTAKSVASRTGKTLNGWHKRTEEERKAWRAQIGSARMETWKRTPMEVRQEMSRKMNERQKERRLQGWEPNADPELIKKRAASVKAFYQTPEGKKVLAERARKCSETKARKKAERQAAILAGA